MYEAPDRYKRMISARLPDGESLGVASPEADEGSSPLRDAQLIARGQFAPFFAIANSVAAVMMATILYGHVPAAYLGGWALAVVVTNLGAMQLARNQAVTHVGRSGRKVPKWQMVGDIAIRAFTWLSLPVISFTTLDPLNQIVAATLVAGLGIAALGLVFVPACVTAWMAIFTAGLSYILLVGRHERVAEVDAGDHRHRHRRAAGPRAVDAHRGLVLAGLARDLLVQPAERLAGGTGDHLEAERHQPGMVGRTQRGLRHQVERARVGAGLDEVLDALRMAPEQRLEQRRDQVQGSSPFRNCAASAGSSSSKKRSTGRSTTSRPASR